MLWLLALNACLGVLALEVQLYKLQRHRTVDESRDNKFPSWRRHDVHNWTRANLYPGALTVLIPRLLLMLTGVIVSILLLSIAFITGFPKDNEPITGCKIKAIQTVNKLFCMLILFVANFRVTTEEKPVDYSKYLGKGYETNASFGSYVGNHSGVMDNVMLLATLGGKISSVSAILYKKMPIVNLFLYSLQTIWVPRGGTQAEKDQSVTLIEQRQKLTEDEGLFPPITVFAEGTTNNNRYLLPFKRGAFSSLLAVKPVVFKYHVDNCTVHPFTDVLSADECFIMALCTFQRVNVEI